MRVAGQNVGPQVKRRRGGSLIGRDMQPLGGPAAGIGVYTEAERRRGAGDHGHLERDIGNSDYGRAVARNQLIAQLKHPELTTAQTAVRGERYVNALVGREGAFRQ